MSKRSMNRRTFVSYSAATSAGAVIAAKAGEVAAAPAASGGSKTARFAQDLSQVKYAKVLETVPAQFQESPMLTEMVNAGQLPPVQERVGPEPLVVEPIEVGQYGGTIRVGDMSVDLGGYDISWVTGRDQHWLRLTPDLTGTAPNMAKSVDVSEDKTTYTLHMRKGMKWSDGTPFTADDFLFWFEDLYQNKELFPSPTSALAINGK